MTVAKLTKLNACEKGVQYFKDHKYKTVEQAISEILKTDHAQRLNWSNWLISRSLSKEDCIRYAVYAAEQVIDIFEKKYPEDKRPREANRAAKVYLKNPSKENKEKCRAAATAAYAYAAAYAAADAYAAEADYNKILEKNIKYGMKLLKNQ